MQCLLNLRFLLQFSIFLPIYSNLLSCSTLIVILSNWICFSEVNHSNKIKNINLSRSLESQTLAWLWHSRGRLIVINKGWPSLNTIELTYREYQPTTFLSEKDIEWVFEHYIFILFPYALSRLLMRGELARLAGLVHLVEKIFIREPWGYI